MKPPFLLVCFHSQVLACHAVQSYELGLPRSGPQVTLQGLLEPRYKVQDTDHFWVKLPARNIAEELSTYEPVWGLPVKAGVSISGAADVILLVYESNVHVRKNRANLWDSDRRSVASLPEDLLPMVQPEFPVLDVSTLLVRGSAI